MPYFISLDDKRPLVPAIRHLHRAEAVAAMKLQVPGFSKATIYEDTARGLRQVKVIFKGPKSC